jgi:hypothetical protein
MNLSRKKLQRFVIEEYMKEEGLHLEALDQDKYEEFLAWINKEAPKPAWLDGYGKSGKSLPTPPALPGSDIGSLDTMPMDIPSDDAAESEYSGFQDRSGPGPTSDPEDMSDEDLVASISQMIQGRDPDHVAELFQMVFSNIPGVEMDPAEEDPGSLYSHGAEGRPVAGFQLENLMELIREVIAEGDYHDMGGEDEMYNVLDPHGLEKTPDAKLIKMMRKNDMEEMIVLDGKGGLTNRDEVIVALKDV